MQFLRCVLLAAMLCFEAEGSLYAQTAPQNFSSESRIPAQSFWEHIPSPTRWTNDYERLFTPAQCQQLDSLIGAFEQETTIEIAIVTLDTVHTSKEKFDDLTLKIANSWGVGKKESNNGILIGISRGHRKMYIRNGIGIEKILTNQETKYLIDHSFIPFFRQGLYFEGTREGLLEIMQLLRTRLH